MNSRLHDINRRGGDARAIGAILTRAPAAKQRRTFQPVRRNSYNVGEREQRWYRPVNPREIGARLRAAERFNERTRQQGSRRGPIGEIGLEVLRLLYRVVCHRTGRLEPSIDYICTAIRRSRKAVVGGLARLKQHGFLDWIRRTEPVANPGERGPQVVQISNAYVLLDPSGKETSVTAAPPLPDDVIQAAEAAADDLRRMIDQVSTSDRLFLEVEDDALRRSLLNLAKTAGWS